MSLKKWMKLSEKVLFTNKHWTYKLDQFEIEGVTRSEYHYVHSPGSTMVIPKLSNSKILLTNQFRYLNQKESLEFPCGSIDGNLSKEVNALKELREETGFTGNLKFIGEFSPYTGVSNEMCSVFIATDLIKSPLPSDLTEEFELLEFTIQDFENKISQNIIWDGLTLSAWQLAKKYFI
ncbi:MAG: NUDIX hydrolase [Ignavibacteriae bacterium]|nr:NUDIX hydrolase [Ignavibacteriota bacterium]